ncbi:MAG: Lrp/AsnC ligand binding domain-containing protein [Candidatus Thorarchaeota archaeon]
MVTVIILIRARAGSIWDACKMIEKFEGVKSAHTVTGPYDIIVYAELEGSNDLGKLTKGIHTIEGIERTETCIAI